MVLKAKIPGLIGHGLMARTALLHQICMYCEHVSEAPSQAEQWITGLCPVRLKDSHNSKPPNCAAQGAVGRAGVVGM